MLFMDKQKIIHIMGIVVGIIIIIVGFGVQGTEIDAKSYLVSGGPTIGSSIKFGADFYTEMYAVTKDVGKAVNSAQENISASINNAQRNVCNAFESICKAIGWLIVAIGGFDAIYFAVKLFDSSFSVKYTSHTKNVQSSVAKAVKTTDDKWICSCCKTENSMDCGQCEKCGTFRGIN